MKSWIEWLTGTKAPDDKDDELLNDVFYDDTPEHKSEPFSLYTHVLAFGSLILFAAGAGYLLYYAMHHDDSTALGTSNHVDDQ